VEEDEGEEVKVGGVVEAVVEKGGRVGGA